jgi:CheY-like chemotaxis protein
LTCDPTQKSLAGMLVFALLMGAATGWEWVYGTVQGVWAYIDAASVPGSAAGTYAWIGVMTGLLVQGALAAWNRYRQGVEEQANADRKAQQEREEAERQFKREQLEADRKAALGELHHQLDDMKQDMERVALEAQRKVDDAARELKRRDDQAEAERRQLAREKEALKLRVSELEKTVPPIEAKTAAVTGRVDAIQAEQLKQNFMPQPDPERPPDAPRPTVVIIEDEPEAVRGLAQLFSASGFYPRTAVTLEDARALIDMHPHFAVVDLKLAGEDATELIRAIQAAGSYTEIVVFTGAEGARLDEARRLVGEDKVFQKGSAETPKRVVEQVKRMLEERRKRAGA